MGGNTCKRKAPISIKQARYWKKNNLNVFWLLECYQKGWFSILDKFCKSSITDAGSDKNKDMNKIQPDKFRFQCVNDIKRVNINCLQREPKRNDNFRSTAPQINETFDFEHHIFKNGAHLDFFKIPKSATEFSPEDMGIVIAKAAELSHLMFTREKKEFYSSMMNYLKYEHSHISKDQLIEWRNHLEKSLIRGLAFYLFEGSIGEEVHLESVLFHALPDRLHEVELMHREEMLEAIVNGFIGEFCQRFVPIKENKVEEDERNRMNYEEPTLL